MTKTEIDAIRARYEAATPRPWIVFKSSVVAETIVTAADGNNGKGVAVARVCNVRSDKPLSEKDYINAEFIADARENIPKLLDTLEASESKCEELKADLERETAAHALKNALIADLEAERDRYKERCQALERAALKHQEEYTSLCFTCYSCVNVESRHRFDKKHPQLYPCSGCGKGHPKWQFDVARFMLGI